jgi:DNA-directed RNA polymerase specialized sigma24 family protein
MDRDAALAKLPEAYATALRLREAGLSDEAIAARLEIAPEAADALLRVADAKLAAIFGAHERCVPPHEDRRARGSS